MNYRVTILLCSLLTATVFASVWRPLEDKDFTAALTYGVEIANSDSAPTSFPYVRIYAVPEVIGECWGALESCPDWRLYIAISMGDLYEEPFLFKFPFESKGWKFEGWQITDEPQTVIFRVTTVLPGTNLDSEVRSDWKPEIFQIAVTPNGPIVTIVLDEDEGTSD